MVATQYVAVFGDALKAARRGRGLSQEELAEKLNVSGGTVSNWELGKTHYVSVERRHEIARALSLSDAYFDNMLFGEQFSKAVTSDFSEELLEAAKKLEIADAIRELIAAQTQQQPQPQRIDPVNMVNHSESTHAVHSPHNGIAPNGSIKTINGAEAYPLDVRYVVRVIQELYNYWLNNPERTNAHWWFTLAHDLLYVTDVKDWQRLREMIPDIAFNGLTRNLQPVPLTTASAIPSQHLRNSFRPDDV